ncbi:MAG: alpha/beta fold hydrolase [Pseudoxanthomonas sp.]|jgi:polyhydroxyalkanoate synthase|nr:alpha/beta fold hydrolase [Pseudoxanthomonas sp.]
MKMDRYEESCASTDTEVHAAWAKAWLQLSPESAVLAWTDWLAHLATSPAKQAELSELALAQMQRMATLVEEARVRSEDGGEAPVSEPCTDRRFADSGWSKHPFSLFRESFRMQSEWWNQATSGVWGVAERHQRAVEFAVNQWQEALFPGNFPWLNPVVQERTRAEDGANLARGLSYFLDDALRIAKGLAPAGAERFQVGRDVATTPGKVVLRNRLIELIQYTPSTEHVCPEPILVVPAWIMKYYILDLSPHNSLIKYLVDQGHTVFCISWKNPGADDRDLGMDDYLELGIQAALAAVEAIVPETKIHAAGYCIGGTLLSIAAAAMARDGDSRLASLTLLAAQTDFSEPGELSLFINESQLAFLDALMAETGYLDARHMGGAFLMLRAHDLVWSRLINEYLLGDRQPLNDLMAWNADGTHMPARMHSQYLRRLYLNNDLSGGRYRVGDRPVSLGDLRLPIFGVGTTSDHVAPWQSVYKLHLFSPAEITFVLTNGGHNAGIVSALDHPRRRFDMHTRAAGAPYLAPDEWRRVAKAHSGSWWPAWLAWLRSRSGAAVKPPRVGAARKGYRIQSDAPGDYVRSRALLPVAGDVGLARQGEATASKEGR